jgi:hypothetical protein
MDEEEIVVDRIKSKLKVTWDNKLFNKRVFEELEIANFKRLSFLSDIMEKWDTSHLTGYPAIIASSGLSLNRKTDELEFYKDLFQQLDDREKLIHFLAWAVAGLELDESVIDKIVPNFTDEKICEILATMKNNIKIVDPKDCVECGKGDGYVICMKCARTMFQTNTRIRVPHPHHEDEGYYFDLCGCEHRTEGQIMGTYERAHMWPCTYHKN